MNEERGAEQRRRWDEAARAIVCAVREEARAGRRAAVSPASEDADLARSLQRIFAASALGEAGEDSPRAIAPAHTTSAEGDDSSLCLHGRLPLNAVSDEHIWRTWADTVPAVKSDGAKVTTTALVARARAGALASDAAETAATQKCILALMYGFDRQQKSAQQMAQVTGLINQIYHHGPMNPLALLGAVCEIIGLDARVKAFFEETARDALQSRASAADLRLALTVWMPPTHFHVDDLPQLPESKYFEGEFRRLHRDEQDCDIQPDGDALRLRLPARTASCPHMCAILLFIYKKRGVVPRFARASSDEVSDFRIAFERPDCEAAGARALLRELFDKYAPTNLNFVEPFTPLYYDKAPGVRAHVLKLLHRIMPAWPDALPFPLGAELAYHHLDIFRTPHYAGLIRNVISPTFS